MTNLTSLLVLAQDYDTSGGGAVGGILACVIFLIVAAIGLALFAFWIWMLIDAVRRDFPGNEKIVWILVIVLLQALGALVYFFVGRSRGTLPGGPSGTTTPTL